MIRQAAGLLAGVFLATTAMADRSSTLLDWSDLDGWSKDDHGAALGVFLKTCKQLDEAAWTEVCDLVTDVGSGNATARHFFEAHFQPVLIVDGKDALFTGYYEPEIRGSRKRTATHRWPIYRKPPEIRRGQKWHSRAEIETRGLLNGRGLEIAWIDDPLDVFFLHIQGSGRVALEDGTVIRVGFGGRNGHKYRSVGREMIRRGLLDRHEASAGGIRQWVRENPEEGTRILHHNPSFIFFREVNDVPPEEGPLGAMNRSVTSMRSVAVDPAYTPLGAPVWLETEGREPLRRLMIAQDTGSAIKGAQRADVFVGSGSEAGRTAGRMRDRGRMVILLPREIARALASRG